MQNVMNLSKRAFTVAVVVATILWSVGASALVAPLAASAATTLADGDLIKGSLSTVYYYYSGERWTFPNEKTYMTWYENFDDVMTVSDSQLASYPLAGNITMRAGTWMVKVDTDPKTYVVTTDGEIRWVETAEVAADLYGDTWNQWVVDVPDVFFSDYSEGSSMMTAELVDGMLVESGSDTYLIWDGEKRMVSSAGMTANRLMDKFVISDSSVSLSDYSTGSSISSEVPSLSDASQQATGETASSGDLNVSISGDSPEGQSVPRSATNVQLFAVDLEAGASDVDVSVMTFHFTGLSEVSILDNVYVYWNGARLSNGKSINSTTRNVTFSGLDITVGAGETETVWLTGDVDDSAFGTASVSFSIEDEDAITSSAATVDGDFPVEGDSSSFTSAAEVGTITIDNTGSLSDVTIGQEGAEIARFTLDAQDEDAMIESITLNVDKADDHSAYELWQSSTKIADGESIGDDLVLFSFDDAYTVLDGNTKTFKVTADIGGDPNDMVSVALEESSDLTAIGGDFGFGMQVTNGYGDDGEAACTAGGNCSQVDIIGGKLTLAFNGPSSATDLQIGGDDQAIFNFTLTSQNAATVNSLEFDLTMTDADDGTDFNFENFRIVKEDGSTLMGPEELSTIADLTQTLVFDDEFDIAAGESWDLSLVTDISDTADAADGDDITAVLDSSETDAEDTEGNTLVVGTDIVPTADLNGNAMNLTDASLTINLAGSPSSATVVKGSQDVDMVGFSFTAGEASDIVVTSADFHVLVDSDGDDTFDEAGDIAALAADDRITSCSLYNASGELIDGPESPDSDADVSFDSFDWTVPAGDTSKLIVNCDLANLAVVATPDEYSIEIADVDNIIAEDADGDQLSGGALVLTDGNGADTIEVGVVAAGTLTVATGSDSPDATIIIGGSSDVEVGVFRFAATTEAFTIDSITILNAGNDRVADTVSLSYENEDGDMVTADSVFSGGSAAFEGLEFYVPAEGTADVTVTVDTSSVAPSGATSGDSLVLSLDESVVSYTGMSSGTTTVDTASGADPAADTFELRKTKPTLSRASGSPSGSAIPGLDEVLRFNIAADSHGYVAVNELTFKLTSTDNDTSAWNTCDGGDIATSDFSLYNYDDLSDELESADGNWSFFDSGAGDAGFDCDAGQVITYINLDLGTAFEVAAGATETYSLYVDTTGASSSDDDTIRFDLGNQATTLAETNNSTIDWDDDTQADAVDGDNVKTLPMTGGTLVY